MIISVLTFILVLSILVLVHELGHFIAARRAGIWVEEFGFGLPPRLFGKRIGETLYSLNALPFGGFVRLHGETDEGEITKPERAFLTKSKKIRSVVVLAGVFMNFVLAIFAFATVYTFSGFPKTIDTGKVKILDVRHGSPAEEAGLASGDLVVEAEGQKMTKTEEFIKLAEEKKGEEITLKIQKEGEEALTEIKVTPRVNPPEGEGALGVAISSAEVEYYFPPVWQRPFLGAYYGFKEAFFWGGVVIGGMIKLFADLFGGVFPKGVAGPTGLFAITTEVAKLGVSPLINWLGVISVNLAVLNILPFPALDGGHLLFIGIEKVLGKRVVPKVQSWVHGIGLAILLLFIIAITVKEFRQISQLGFSGYVEFLTKGGEK